MRRIIKKVFIPHEGNNYHPHFWRWYSVLSIAVLSVVIFFGARFGAIILPRLDFTAAVLPSVLVDLANNDRLSNQLRTLKESPILQRAAALKAEDMAGKSYFAHISPEGKKPWHWFREAGYSFIYAGENLAMDYTDSEAVNLAWMKSPTHRANILNENFTEIGIAMANGYIDGRPTTFVVQMFGQPIPQDLQQEAPVVAKPREVPRVRVAPSPVVVGEPEIPLETIAETQTFVAVKNSNVAGAETETPTVAGQEEYSSWFTKMLLSPRKTLAYMYVSLGLLIVIALFLLVGIEVGKHHRKHVIYGMGLLLLIILLFYLSRSIIITEVLVL